MQAISSPDTATGAACIAATSPPAMKPRPSPETTSTRASASAATASQAARKACAMGTSIAFSACGRLKRSCATPPSRQARTGALRSSAAGGDG